MTALLSARGVVKSYGRTQALRGITLAVDAGEIVAVTGPSGCGKSTLLSAAENVALPLLLAGTKRAEARTAALSWLERLGVADLADSPPGEMSGGEQQRTALARALVTEPRVLFADEPERKR